MVVKPKRHVVHLADLDTNEAAELGPLLSLTSQVVSRLLPVEQVYTCLWSYAPDGPVHVHFIVQPVTSELLSTYAASGPRLQAAMFDRNELPSPDDIAEVADQARLQFRALTEGDQGPSLGC
jgi:diadenosine tetraphosphate (Ap4A) HIT family hydrolase